MQIKLPFKGLLLSTIFVSSIATITFSQDGSFDTSFNGNGEVSTDVASGSNEICFAVTTQSDGKIITAGMSDGDMVLLRYNSNGSLDNSFGVNGIVTESFGNISLIQALEIQSDGKILMGGQASINGFHEIVIMRLNTDGSPDNSYGNNGKVHLNISNLDDHLSDMKLQADGKLVSVGTALSAQDNEIIFIRLNTDGSLDTSFGVNGISNISNGVNYGLLRELDIHANGKIVAAGETNIPGAIGMMVVRLNDDGSLDNSFNSTGIVITDFVGGSSETTKSVCVLANEKIIVGGGASNLTDNDFALKQFNANGTLDTSFGSNGLVMSDLGYNEEVTSMIVSPNGKIIALGNSSNAFVSSLKVSRFLSDGSVDVTFNGGSAGDTVSSGMEFASQVAMATDGKIIAAGYSVAGISPDFILFRLNNDDIVGVNEQEISSFQVNCFPNPTSQNFGISIRGYSDGPLQLTLRTVLGQVVLQKEISDISKVQDIQLTGANGIYFGDILDKSGVRASFTVVKE